MRFQASRKVECAALALLALHPNPSVHHLDQAAGNGQSQPRAAEFPGEGTIHLSECFKNEGLFVGGNADPCVDYGEVESIRVLRRTLDSEREPGKRNVVYSVDCMGLIGVSLLAKGDPQWANSLTADQAMLAAQYATLEINGFPSWLSSLAQIWPHQVGEVLLR